ncbi:hypothetical protein [Pinibacter soli]|nr:hypothetical protein [Pinibacter soli]
MQRSFWLCQLLSLEPDICVRQVDNGSFHGSKTCLLPATRERSII